MNMFDVSIVIQQVSVFDTPDSTIIPMNLKTPAVFEAGVFVLKGS